MGSDEKLAGLRKEIDETDAALNELFRKRMRAAEKIAEAKAESRAPAEDKEREKEVIETAVSAADSDLKRETEVFFKTLISFSKIRQAEKRGNSGNFGTLQLSSEDSAAAGRLEYREDCDTVLAAFCVPGTGGDLNAVLQIFILCGINIIRIEPGKDSEDGSTYYVQLQADYRDENVRCMLAHAASQCAGFRILGRCTAEK